MKKPSKREVLDKILYLFDSAEETIATNQTLANKFVKSARRIAMKFKVRLPANVKKMFCKHCGVFFIPGKNYRVRIKDKKLIYTCFACRHIARFPTKTRN